MPPKIPIDPKKLEYLYLNKKFSERKCARIFGCTHGAISRAIIESKIPKRIYGNGVRKRTIIQKSILVELYQAGNLTISECAKRIGTTNNIVHLSLLEHNIPLRDPNHIPVYNIPREWLEQKYITEGLSLEACADIIGCTHHTIASELNRNGIEQIRRDTSGASNPNWRGGRASLPYCPAFTNELREEVREAFGRKCFLCNKPENGRKLSVHHVDYLKSQGCRGHKWGLIPLCTACHARTNVNRWRWFAQLRDYWIYKYIDFVLMQGGMI